MNKFAIIADGSCDLSEKFQREYDIRIVPGHLNYPGESEEKFTLQWTPDERDASRSPAESAAPATLRPRQRRRC